MTRVITVGALVLAATAAAVGISAAADQPKVTAKVCTAVKDRAPVGEGDTFPAAVGELYCFTEVLDGPATVVHAWFHDGTEVRAIELPVKGPRWRTWSVKKIPAGMVGEWRVDVRDPAGAVLASVKFTVR